MNKLNLNLTQLYFTSKRGKCWFVSHQLALTRTRRTVATYTDPEIIYQVFRFVEISLLTAYCLHTEVSTHIVTQSFLRLPLFYWLPSSDLCEPISPYSSNTGWQNFFRRTSLHGFSYYTHSQNNLWVTLVAWISPPRGWCQLMLQHTDPHAVGIRGFSASLPSTITRLESLVRIVLMCRSLTIVSVLDEAQSVLECHLALTSP